MSKKLAILGHEYLGKKVVELLKMLGGKDADDYKCSNPNRFYYISDEYVCWDYNDSSIVENKFEVFTLEEFLEKFPFKVGDFVGIPEYESEVRICKMKWTSFSDIDYLVYRNDDEEWYTAYELLQYNDNPNKTIKDMDEKDKAKAPDLKGEDYSGKRFGYKIPDGYEFDTVYNGNIILKPIKPQYPKTYKECCDVLGLNTMDNDAQGYKANLIIQFQELIIARDAYLKIAGDELGLGKPWKPDWLSGRKEEKYCIGTQNNEIWHDFSEYGGNEILAFPTMEMRDAFYENFKDLIEQCKELL
jgi:hypothetical protein